MRVYRQTCRHAHSVSLTHSSTYTNTVFALNLCTNTTFSSLQLTVVYTGANNAEDAVQAEVDPGATYQIESKERNEGVF